MSPHAYPYIVFRAALSLVHSLLQYPVTVTGCLVCQAKTVINPFIKGADTWPDLGCQLSAIRNLLRDVLASEGYTAGCTRPWKLPITASSARLISHAT